MLALRDLQETFGRALLDGEEAPSALLNAFSDQPFAGERFAIYRNNVLTSLTAVLHDTFPVVCKLVDGRFFAYAAHEFIRAHPPARPALSEYGASFAGFLESFPPCRDLAYLRDVARLEWLMHLAATSEDERALPSAALAGFAAEDTAQLRFKVSMHYLQSPWPVDRIWRANQPDALDEIIALDGAPARLEISRRAGVVGFRTLDPPSFAFRRALADGVPLGAALEQALVADPDFAPTEALAKLFRDGAVIAVLHP